HDAVGDRHLPGHRTPSAPDAPGDEGHGPGVDGPEPGERKRGEFGRAVSARFRLVCRAGIRQNGASAGCGDGVKPSRIIPKKSPVTTSPGFQLRFKSYAVFNPRSSSTRGSRP